MGRFKYSGSFLDLTDDRQQLDAPPAFETDQTNRTVPVDSHVRKSNPRRPEDAQRRIFRRGYPLIAGSTAGFDRGLLFVAFARSISTQFEFIFRAWMRNPNFPEQSSGPDRIFRFEKQVLAGGYYFVPPPGAPQSALVVDSPQLRGRKHGGGRPAPRAATPAPIQGRMC